MGRRGGGNDADLAKLIVGVVIFVGVVYRDHIREILFWLAFAFALGVIAILFFKIRQKTPPPSRSVQAKPVQVAPAHRPTSLLDGIGQSDKSTASTSVNWSIELIRSLEWKRFEELCDNYFKAKGWTTKPANFGPDGGVDIFLYGRDSTKPLGIVQCKAWGSAVVSVKEIRELFGIMADIGSTLGIFITTSAYSQDAKRFAADKHIKLMDGSQLLGLIQALPSEQQKTLLETAIEGDYQTPSCPKCGVKLVIRNGPNSRFWGCGNFPRCRYTMRIRNST